MNGWVILLHVLGATVWTGGHLVLALTVLPRARRARDPGIVRDFESGYEKFGIAALILQVVTGLWLAHDVIRAVGLDMSNPYTRRVVEKLTILVLTIGLALHARFRVLPRVTPDRMGGLTFHIWAVTVLAVMFVVIGVSLRTGGL
jgi:putative copper export protein